MKHIIETLAEILYEGSKFLYEVCGIETRLHERGWKKHVEYMQSRLDHAHNLRDKINEEYNKVFTTKPAIDYIRKNS